MAVIMDITADKLGYKVNKNIFVVTRMINCYFRKCYQSGVALAIINSVYIRNEYVISDNVINK